MECKFSFLSQGIANKRPDKSTHKVSFERAGDSLTGDRKETGSSKQDRLPGTTGHDVSGISRSYTGGTGVDSSSRQPAQGDDRNGTVSSAWSRYVDDRNGTVSSAWSRYVDDRNGTVSSAWSRYVGESDRPERMAYYGLIIVCAFFAILSGCPIFVDWHIFEYHRPAFWWLASMSFTPSLAVS